MGTSQEKWIPHFAGVLAFALVDGSFGTARDKVGWVLRRKSGYPTSRDIASGAPYLALVWSSCYETRDLELANPAIEWPAPES